MKEWGHKLDCRTCDDKLKEERGHYKEGIIPYIINKERVFRCPLMMITPLSYEYIKAFSFYEKGCFPNGVGWLNESNRYIQAMLILENEFNRIQNKELDHARTRTKSSFKTS